MRSLFSMLKEEDEIIRNIDIAEANIELGKKHLDTYPNAEIIIKADEEKLEEAREKLAKIHKEIKNYILNINGGEH